jgi:hypothetical protein
MLAALFLLPRASKGEFRRDTKMSTILLLIDEVPWLMVPAAFIAVTSLITLVSVVIRHTRWAFKSVVLATMLALTAGVTMFK